MKIAQEAEGTEGNITQEGVKELPMEYKEKNYFTLFCRKMKCVANYELSGKIW